MEVTAGRQKVMAAYAVLWRDSLHVTCGLTACTLGSAPGPALGNEYGKTLPFTATVNSIMKRENILCVNSLGYLLVLHVFRLYHLMVNLVG